MKTEAQITDEVFDEHWSDMTVRQLMVRAIEKDREQRNGALRDYLRQVRRQEGDWRGVLDLLIGDEDDLA